jgi:unsaturated chondroitin disaccharide hydrolase
MKNIFLKKPLFLALFIAIMLPANGLWYKNNIKKAEKQTRYLISQCSERKLIPRTYSPVHGVEYVKIQDWTSGFFPGVLWYLHYHTNKDYWKKEAIHYTELLSPIQHFSQHHDVGFMIMSSYGLGFALNNDPAYRQVIINSADALITRYRDVAGTIQSWDKRVSRTGVHWECPVIIDNMMNLELLFKATQLTGDKKYYDIAIKHADNTLKNHIRPDYSTYHLVNYDLNTGEVTDRDTWQGFSRNSTWARGQAWGIYGFVMSYRETGDQRYLDTAIKLTDFYLNHKNMPKDLVPWWDFNSGEAGFVPDWDYKSNGNQPVSRDASAAAIVASALLEMSTISPELNKKYYKVAETMLKSLSSSNYFAGLKSNGGFILKNSVGNMPRGLEIDVPLNYADYYYLEALHRYTKINKK